MYKVKVWHFHVVIDSYNSDSLEDARRWYVEEWKEAEDMGNCWCQLIINGIPTTDDQNFELLKKDDD